MDVINLFPIPVYKNNVSYKLSEQEYDYINSIDLNCTQENGTIQDGNNSILDNPAFGNLKLLLQQELDVYSKQIFDYDCDVYITSSWLNINSTNTAHISHNHVNSVFSGVFYIDVTEESPGLTFINHRNPMFHITPRNFNNFNCQRGILKVNKGDVVIFPSELFHEVSTNRTPTKRISLAFNSFIRGSIGDLNLSNYIEIK